VIAGVPRRRSRRLWAVRPLTALCPLVLALAPACGDNLPATASTVLVVRVTDGVDGPPLAAKVVLYQGDEPLRIGWLDMFDGRDQDLGFCALADGVVGTWDGIALPYGAGDIPVGTAPCGPVAVPHGVYRVRVLRGGEHEMFETAVDLGAERGRVLVDAPLERVFTPVGLAADLHIHAAGSPDSRLPRRIRVITEVAAGIQVLGSSDHNVHGDFTAEIADLGLAEVAASLPGSELSADVLHFNILPVDPEAAAPTYEEVARQSVQQLFDYARGLPGRPLLQINHPRLGWAAYFDSVGWDGERWPPPMPVDFDALEVLSALTAFNAEGDQRLERAVRDFYTLWRHGVFVTALGNSDTHHLNGVLAGFPRSYVLVDDARLSPFDAEAFVAALRGHRVVATTGPWLDVRVGGQRAGGLAVASDGAVPITIEVRQASYVKATRARIWIGGELHETLELPPGARAWSWTGSLPIGADTWVGVDVGGDEPLPVEMTGDYHVARGRSGMLPFALINPIRVDATGDGFVYAAAKPVPRVDVPPFDPPLGPIDCMPH
jgi:hypothetical protein